MSKLNNDYAKALCTAITVGFIIESGSQKYIYEKDEDKGEHDTLKANLLRYGVDIEVKKQGDSTVILAGQSAGYTAYDISNDLQRLATYLPQKLKREHPDLNTPGSYVGGMITSEVFRFVGVSELYLRDPLYRDISGGDQIGITDSYVKASNITLTINDFLKSMGSFSIGAKYIKNVSIEPSLVSRLSQRPEAFKTGKLFASCHGMIAAIQTYSSDISRQPIIELAFGPDTCKIASCIPCSMYMTACGKPASATHFGRGDNWNFSKGRPVPNKGGWTANIINYYKSGINKLSANSNISNLKGWVTTNSLMDKLPDVFLDALTFEGSFINKINSVLGG